MKTLVLKDLTAVLVVLLFSGLVYSQPAGNPYVTVWETNKSPLPSNKSSVTLPVGSTETHYGTFYYEYEEVGNPSNNGSGLVNDWASRTVNFGTPGVYRLKMWPDGTYPFDKLSMSASDDNAYQLISVEQWGDVEWSTLDRLFYECENLTEIVATDLPNLSNVTTANRTFYNSAVETVQNINDWDVSNIEDMSFMFYSALEFDQDISGWDVSNVKTMEQMFSSALKFNQDISGWNMSSVESLEATFMWAIKFNQDLSNWDVGNVNNMLGTFTFAEDFNQDLSSWDISNVTDMGGMFGASGMDCMNYSLVLYGWANMDNPPQNISFSSNNNVVYSPNVEDARNHLINNLGWNISGDALGSCIIENLGINTFEASMFDLYPNPTNTSSTLTGLTGQEDIRVVDINGRVLYSLNENNSESVSLDLNSFESGMYFIRIANKEGKSVVKKVVKE